MSLLAVDIGNSRVSAVLIRGKGIPEVQSVDVENLSSPAAVARFLRDVCKNQLKDVGDICIVSVVPAKKIIFKTACRNLFDIDPVFADTENVGLKLSGYDPKQIGMDRLVNVLGAFHEHKKAVIVIDAGSCITFDVVSDEGSYLGGAIVPGISLSSAALSEKTARLPLVEIKRPKKSIGKSTEESIRSGIYNGYAGLVDGIVEKISGEMKGKPFVIVTGGDAKLISKAANSIDKMDEKLIFKGLSLLSSKKNI